MKQITWDTSKDKIMECLNEAGNTFSQLVEDLSLNLSEEELIEIDRLFTYQTAINHINTISINDIKTPALHPSCHNILEQDSISYTGCIVIINDEYMLDGNHRYNTLLELSRANNQDIEFPVLYLYKDF